MSFLKQINDSRRVVVPTTRDYNTIVRALNGGRISNGRSASKGNQTLATVFNGSLEHSIEIGWPVFFHADLISPWITDYVVRGFPFQHGVVTDSGEELPWGIAQEEIPPGHVGIVQLSGVVNMNVGNLSNGNQYVGWKVEGDVLNLVTVPSGCARILSRYSNGNVSVLLNSVNSNGGVYDGPFAAKIAMEDGEYVVLKVNSGLIVAGTELVEVAEETFTFGSDTLHDYNFLICATLVYNELLSQYVAETVYHSDLYEPLVPTAERCVWRIASYDKDTKKLTQIQYGDIQVAGRCVS